MTLRVTHTLTHTYILTDSHALIRQLLVDWWWWVGGWGCQYNFSLCLLCVCVCVCVYVPVLFLSLFLRVLLGLCSVGVGPCSCFWCLWVKVILNWSNTWEVLKYCLIFLIYFLSAWIEVFRKCWIDFWGKTFRYLFNVVLALLINWFCLILVIIVIVECRRTLNVLASQVTKVVMTVSFFLNVVCLITARLLARLERKVPGKKRRKRKWEFLVSFCDVR